jgi:hypothetical protein
MHRGLVGPCRINGCPCDEFADPKPVQNASPRRVCFEIPEGFIARVEITPIGAGNGS